MMVIEQDDIFSYEKGVGDTQNDIAINALKEGVDVQFVALITQLSVSRVKALKNQLEKAECY